MGVTNTHPVADDLTRALIEQIAGGELGAKLRSQVAAWHPGAVSDDVEEAFQEACLIAQRACRGQREGEVYTWLRTTTHRELAHQEHRARRRCRREVLVDISALEVAETAAPGPDEEVIEREEMLDIELATRSVLDRLSERQRQVAVLHSNGFKRPEIAQRLGVTPRSVKRDLERIMAVGRAELVRLAGDGCETGEDLVARFAFGLASPRERAHAQLHLAGCRKCGSLHEQLGLWHEKVAALLPVPAVVHTRPGTIERVADVGVDGLSHLKRRVVDAAETLHEHLGAGSAHIKQHAAATYYRTVDPTPLAGVRPGAVAAAVASCVALGGGATYCVEQGVDPIGAFRGDDKPAHRTELVAKPKKTKRARVEEPVTATTPTPTVGSPPPATATTPSGQGTSEQSAGQTTTQESSPPPAPQDEYEPVSPASSTSSTNSTEPSPSTPATPAPAPADGPGEFDGP